MMLFTNLRIKDKTYLGDIDFYLEQRQLENLREAERKTIVNRIQKSSNKQSYEAQKQLKSLNNRLSKLESTISSLEKEIKAIDLELEISYDKTVADPNFFDTYQAKKSKLEELMSQWEMLTESIEQHN